MSVSRYRVEAPCGNLKHPEALGPNLTAHEAQTSSSEWVAFPNRHTQSGPMLLSSGVFTHYSAQSRWALVDWRPTVNGHFSGFSSELSP